MRQGSLGREPCYFFLQLTFRVDFFSYLRPDFDEIIIINIKTSLK